MIIILIMRFKHCIVLQLLTFDIASVHFELCVGTYRADRLVRLLDDLLDLPQNRDLHVLQLLVLCGGICDAGPVCGLRLLSLRQTHTVSKTQPAQTFPTVS